MSEPAKSAAMILIAAVGFSAVAFVEGRVRTDQSKCVPEPRVIHFFPVPEPIPLIPTPSWSWPLSERLDRIETDDPVPEPQTVSDESPHYRHMRRHRRWR